MRITDHLRIAGTIALLAAGLHVHAQTINAYRYWFDDKVVAMDLCIQDDVAIVILKTTYDESYKVVSPSTLMRHDQFQQLFDERAFPRIEFFGKVMELSLIHISEPTRPY